MSDVISDIEKRRYELDLAIAQDTHNAFGFDFSAEDLVPIVAHIRAMVFKEILAETPGVRLMSDEGREPDEKGEDIDVKSYRLGWNNYRQKLLYGQLHVKPREEPLRIVTTDRDRLCKVKETRDGSECNWVSAENRYVKFTEICTTCLALRPMRNPK